MVDLTRMRLFPDTLKAYVLQEIHAKGSIRIIMAIRSP